MALGLGARYRTFPVEADEAKAASSLAAWRKDGRVYVPLRPLADALGLSYQAQVGIQLDLPGPGSSRWRPGPKATSSASAGR